MLDKDIFATNVYTIGYEDDSWSNLDFTQKLLISNKLKIFQQICSCAKIYEINFLYSVVLYIIKSTYAYSSFYLSIFLYLIYTNIPTIAKLIIKNIITGIYPVFGNTLFATVVSFLFYLMLLL